MKRKYVLSFDYMNSEVNKFSWGFHSIDLNTESLEDFCKEKVREMHPSLGEVDIKIIAFNNIHY